MIDLVKSIQFANPQWFWLLLIIPLLAAFYWIRLKNKAATLNLSSSDWLGVKPAKSLRQRIRHLPFIIRVIIIILLITIVARPQTSDSNQTTNIEGIDILLAIDLSTSMQAMDLKPNRLEAAKKTAIQFIEGRPNDRIGIVVFAGEAYTQCPLTTDHQVLKGLIEPLKFGTIEDGTALGDGLATALNRIKDSKAISKVVILLTDGVQTAGSLDPLTAAGIAEKFGIRVYPIGVGTKGLAPTPVPTPFGNQIVNMEVKIDEATLKKVAEKTGGNYFRATNNKSLEDVFNEIDKLEKTRIEIDIFKTKYDQYRPLLWLAFALLLIEVLLRLTYLRSKI